MLTQEADTLSKARTRAHTHSHTRAHTLLHPPSDAILITSLRFDLSPLDQMADVFILEGEEMEQERFHIARRHKTGWRTSLSEEEEDDGGVCLSAGGSHIPSAESGKAGAHLYSLWRRPGSQGAEVYHNLKEQLDTERKRKLLVHQYLRFSDSLAQV